MHLKDEYANARAFCDGDIYRHLRHHQLHGNIQEAAKWSTRLSASKARYVKQLQEKELELCKVFDKLLSYIGLWSSFELGALHKILPVHCPTVRLLFF